MTLWSWLLSPLPARILCGGLLLATLAVGGRAGLNGQDLGDPSLPPAQRDRIVREQERLWRYGEGPYRGRREAIDDGRLATEAALRSETQVFAADGDGGANIVLNSGTRLTIPEGAFLLARGQRSDRVRVEVVELRQPGDFAFAGVSTATVLDGKPVLLESAGMIRLQISSNGFPVRVNPKRAIHWEAQPTADGAFQVYRANQRGGWERVGLPTRNEQVAAGRGCAPADSRGGGGGCPDAFENPEAREGPPPTLAFDRIDRNGWWNFDKPQPEFTCIRGEIQGAKVPVMVRGMGLYRNWVSVGVTDSGHFLINVMRDEQTKVAVAYEQDKRAFVASFVAFRSPKRIMHTSAPDAKKRCRDIGRARVREVAPEVLRDKAKFLRAIQWEA